MTHCSDRFALPRCKETSLRLPIGAWEYTIATEAKNIAELIARGWKVVSQSGDRAVLKYTHREVIE